MTSAEAIDVVIVDYGIGNVASIRNMLAKAGYSAELSADPTRIGIASHLILPGVGAYDDAVTALDSAQLRSPLIAAFEGGARLLGVCLGMQLLMEGSEEGLLPGLGLIPGHCVRFPATVEDRTLRIPHMGWSTVTRTESATALPSLGLDDARYYFVHSYHVVPEQADDVLGTSHYGVPFVSSVARGRVVGVQFHPEKSHRYGLRLLADFMTEKSER